MVVWSALLHAAGLGLVLASPNLIRDREPPRVIAVELIAPAPPAPAAAPKPAPAPPPPEAVPAPPPPPPPPEPKAIVLPEKQTAPKPKEKPKPQKEVFKEPPKKQEKSLDDLLAEMRQSEPAPPAPSQPVETAVAAPTGEPSEGSGELSLEEAAWRASVIRKMKGVWGLQPGFRTQPLLTRVTVTLDAAGNIIGDPRITKKSGNPWYDEGVMRGLRKSSPLPPPPEAGDWVLQFEPGDSL